MFFNPFDFDVKNVANTHVVYWGGKLLALWEGGLPHELDPRTLETLGPTTLGGTLPDKGPFAAHFKIAEGPEGRRLVNFGAAVAGNDCARAPRRRRPLLCPTRPRTHSLTRPLWLRSPPPARPQRRCGSTSLTSPGSASSGAASRSRAAPSGSTTTFASRKTIISSTRTRHALPTAALPSPSRGDAQAYVAFRHSINTHVPSGPVCAPPRRLPPRARRSR